MTRRPVLIPILPVRDLTEADGFWSRVPGVTLERYDEAYAFVMVRGHEVAHLVVVPGLDPASNHAATYLHVPDVDSWHAELDRAGVPVTPLRDEPWGMREASTADPSGNLLRFGTHAQAGGGTVPR